MGKETKQDSWLSDRQAAGLLRMTDQQLNQLARAGQLPFRVARSGRPAYRKSDVLAYKLRLRNS